MAKGYGLTGKIQGKLGSKVYRIEAGEQIISEYNPNKQDAKTQKQIIQRSKLTEVTRVSKYFPWETIAGYNRNRSKARQQFNSFLAKLATTSIVDNTVRATIDLAKIELSRGVPVLLDNWQFTNVSTQDTQLVNASVHIPADTQVVGFLLVVIYSPDPTTQPYRAYYAMSTQRNASGVCNASVTLSTLGPITNGVCYGYAIPLIANTLAKRVVFDDVVKVSANGNLTTEVWVSLARADIFAATVYLDKIIFI